MKPLIMYIDEKFSDMKKEIVEELKDVIKEELKNLPSEVTENEQRHDET